MSSWSEGYFSSVGYTYGYYENLQPQRIIIPFLAAGLIPPKIINACELGFGQGISFNIHSAAGNADWYGTDFNPNHAAFAQQLADSFSSGALISDQAFHEFCQREDLPEFDFIALHGIWSWISDENRAVIVEFIRRKLKIGGVLHISYNTLPGWSAKAPVRHLLSVYQQATAVEGQSHEANVKNTLELSEKTLALSHGLVKESPALADKIQELKNTNINYLAHEYLNKDWQPMYFSEMQEWLEPAKVSFACSSNFLDDFNPVLFSTEQAEFISGLGNRTLMQTAKDFILNKQFRADLWVKGRVTAPHSVLRDAWSELNVMFITARKDFDFAISRRIRTNLNEEMTNPILDLLEDGEVHNVGELYNAIGHDGLFEILSILYSCGHLVLVQDKKDIERAQPRCEKLNRYIMNQAREREDIHYLASPLTGGAIQVNRVEQLFLLAHLQGMESHDWGKFVWKFLQQQGQRLIADGKTLESEEDNLRQLEKLADTFIQNRLPLLKRLLFVA
ncbi:putative methyltransferase family protein [Mesocricetibacter intestinalis]|uniref:Putative methyltransferase family protein n=1 Tax=Mesocricetibacter intestinalis TaxID=1521930 RepID=A0A4R6VEN7_9PAST|nr:class I SAM-dependent methyltransferase [Mesocricetibacter intestinalis]TDQ59445.1 putative methyltransferase family protein [Mesocricetibacter intestinalis]